MNIKDFYTNKLNQFGKDDFRSLNWGDKEGTSAKARYQQMFDHYNWTNKSVFEVGCGWGSFFDFGFMCGRYYGIDINEEFIKIAKEKQTGATFETKEIEEVSAFNNRFDVAISSGVVGNREGPAWHPKMLHTFLNKMLIMSEVSLINFPSTWATIRCEMVEYFSPEQVLNQALQITQNVELIHKEKSDFLLILKQNG